MSWFMDLIGARRRNINPERLHRDLGIPQDEPIGWMESEYPEVECDCGADCHKNERGEWECDCGMIL